MAKKKGRDCTECIAYCNMLGGEGYRYGLGFEVVEDVEGGFGMWIAVVHPYENSWVNKGDGPFVSVPMFPH